MYRVVLEGGLSATLTEHTGCLRRIATIPTFIFGYRFGIMSTNRTNQRCMRLKLAISTAHDEFDEDVDHIGQVLHSNVGISH